VYREFENFRFSHLEAKFLSRNVRRVIYRGTQKFLGQETNASNKTSEKKKNLEFKQSTWHSGELIQKYTHTQREISNARRHTYMYF